MGYLLQGDWVLESQRAEFEQFWSLVFVVTDSFESSLVLLVKGQMCNYLMVPVGLQHI